MPPPIYPELIGLTYNVTKRPIWSTGATPAGSGRVIRVGYWAVNKWEFELKYDFLPDEAGGTTADDLKALEGFFLLPTVAGGLGGFLFDDPDDDSVHHQTIATTDGVSASYTIVRQFAAGTVYEPVGWCRTDETVNVYIDAVLQDPDTYTIDQTYPMNQKLVFSSTPGAGHVIWMDFSFYFYCRFQDDKLDFQKFAEKLWQQDKIILESLRQ